MNIDTLSRFAMITYMYGRGFGKQLFLIDLLSLL